MVREDLFDIYNQDSISKNLIIAYDDKIIENDNIDYESMTIDESLCSSGRITFGACESSTFSITVRNNVEALFGKVITVSQVLEHDTSKTLILGKYKVYEDKPEANRNYREITAYDSMYEINNSDVAEWYNGLTFPLTLKQFRDSFFEYQGIEQIATVLVNDEMIVEKTIDADTISGANVIQAICEINGCFGHITRDDKFKYVFLNKEFGGLYPDNNLFPSDDLYPHDTKATRIPRRLYQTCTYEDYKSNRIDKLQIRENADDIGVVVGNGDIAYVVEDNFLLYGKSHEPLRSIAENLLRVMNEVPPLRPFDCVCKGNPCFEVGDSVSISSKYVIVESVILKRTLTGIQALKDNYVAEFEQGYEEANGLNRTIQQLKGKSNTLTRTVNETRSQITDLETNTNSRFTQTAEQIESKVSKDGVVSSINQTAEKITINANKIDLQGVVEAEEFTSKYATITKLETLEATVNTINANYITAGSVSANYAKISDLNATNAIVEGKASISELEALSGRIGTLEADHVSVSQLNAVNAKFNNLDASNITAGTLSVSVLDIDGIISSMTTKSILASSIACGDLSILDGGSYKQLHFESVKNTKGNIVRVLGIGT